MMPIFNVDIPLSLYIHLPWCIKKCPYCDFNSHELKDSLPQEIYIEALLDDLQQHLTLIAGRKITSIFIGGGTPSLFSGTSIKKLLSGIRNQIDFANEIEITLEANPGTVEQNRFHAFHEAGVNRLSLGIQSFQNEKLKTLGRIHDSDQAMKAIECAKTVGFSNFNLDIMYGLPDQTIEEALNDIQSALKFQPSHFSWYQLTLEPNTLFYHEPPVLPSDEIIWEMQLAGQTLLKENQLQQYEVSAYATANKQCVHNRNYWEFGDYLGLGAGAHSKITTEDAVLRFAQVKHPRDYLDAEKRSIKNFKKLSESDLIFEFMLNALRLQNGVPIAFFENRTGCSIDKIEHLLNEAKTRNFIMEYQNMLRTTELGKRFLNNLIQMFLMS